MRLLSIDYPSLEQERALHSLGYSQIDCCRDVAAPFRVGLTAAHPEQYDALAAMLHVITEKQHYDALLFADITPIPAPVEALILLTATKLGLRCLYAENRDAKKKGFSVFTVSENGFQYHEFAEDKTNGTI